MKRLFFLLSLLLSFSSCSYHLYSTAKGKENLSKDEQKFVASFENAVLKHNEQKFMNYLAPKYVKEQFENMYKSDLKLFTDDFFAGYNDNKKFLSISLSEINYISVEKVSYISKTEKQIYFRVKSANKNIIVDLTLERQKAGSKYKYGFVGAYG